MPRWLKVVLAIFVLLLVYYGSSLAAVYGLAKAVQAGDGAAVLARTDAVALRRSLVAQVLEAYLDPATRQKPVSSRERLVAQTVGATLADAMIEKVLTPDNLTQLLREGKLVSTPDAPAVSVPHLRRLDADDLVDLVTRVRPSSLTRVALRLSPESEGDRYYGARLSFHGTGWTLSELKLPRQMLRELAEKAGMKPQG